MEPVLPPGEGFRRVEVLVEVEEEVVEEDLDLDQEIVQKCSSAESAVVQ